jgi:putative hemolysin
MNYKFLVTLILGAILNGMWVQYRITGTIRGHTTTKQVYTEAYKIGYEDGFNGGWANHTDYDYCLSTGGEAQMATASAGMVWCSAKGKGIIMKECHIGSCIYPENP